MGVEFVNFDEESIALINEISHRRRQRGRRTSSAGACLLRSLRARLLVAFLLPTLLLPRGWRARRATRSRRAHPRGRAGHEPVRARRGRREPAQRRAHAHHRARRRRCRARARGATSRAAGRGARGRRAAAACSRWTRRAACARTRAAGCRWAPRCRSSRATGWSSTRVFAGRARRQPGALHGRGRAALQDGLRAACVAGAAQVVGAVGVEGSAAFFGPLRAAVARVRRGWRLWRSRCSRLMALLTARGLARPLRRLMDAALRIGRGRPDDAGAAGAARGRSACSRASWRRCAGAGEPRPAAEDDARRRRPRGAQPHRRHRALRRAARGGPRTAGARRRRPRSARRAASSSEIDYLQRIVEDFLAFAREQPLQPARRWRRRAARRTRASSCRATPSAQERDAGGAGRAGAAGGGREPAHRGAGEPGEERGAGLARGRHGAGARARAEAARYVIDVAGRGPGVPEPSAGAHLRAVLHHAGEGHRPGAAAGAEDRRRRTGGELDLQLAARGRRCSR